MKFSTMITSTALVLVGAVMLAEASGYYPHNNYPMNRHGSYNSLHGNGLRAVAPVSHAYKCYGYHCKNLNGNRHGNSLNYPYQALNNNNNNNNNGGRNTAYGPYHSYAVQPAIYGGRGLYHYRGYARYPAAPLYRKARSYGTQQLLPLAHPVRALVLAPAYHGNRAYSHQAYIPSYALINKSHSGARATRSHGKYGSGAVSSGGY